jgi:hypothetical protein
MQQCNDKCMLIAQCTNVFKYTHNIEQIGMLYHTVCKLAMLCGTALLTLVLCCNSLMRAVRQQ